MNKYKNKKIEVDGIVFDSLMESRYYEYLLELKKQGIVKDFEMQVPFIIFDSYEMKGRKERPIKLVIDFLIEYHDGRKEAHDTKGMIKPIDSIKKKLFESRYKQKLVFIGYSKIDGGFVDHDVIKQGRKARKKNKTNKI